MAQQLVALGAGPNILLDKPVLLLGRHPDCDVRLKSRKVSRRHCCVARVDDGVFIRDLGSKNGIRINGRRVTEGHVGVSDELIIGRYRYRVGVAEKSASRKPHSYPVGQPAGQPGAFLPTRLDPADSGEVPIPLPEQSDPSSLAAPPAPAAQATLPFSLSGTQVIPAPAREAPAEESIPAPPPILEKPVVPETSPAPASEDEEAGEVSQRLVLLGLFAFLLGAAAVLSASFAPVLVVPVGGAGLLAGLTAAGLARFHYDTWLRLPLAAAGVNVAVLLLAVVFPSLLGPTYVASRPVTTPAPDTIQAMPLSGSLGDSVGDANWPDAGKAALLQGGLRVQVIAVSVGPVKVPAAAKKKYSKEHYLLIRLRFQQPQTAQEFVNRDWKLPDFDEAEDRTTLTDAAGKSYPQHDILDVGGVRAVRRSGIFPVAVVEVVLVFEPPPAGAGPLHLEIPATPWGGRGTFRFTIPESLIHKGPR
jgi:hypothetical protein